MLRVTELPYEIVIGTTFEHTRQGTIYRYRVMGITQGEENCNDQILLQDLNDLSSMGVEPEWFNQRKIRITTIVNMAIFFENGVATYDNIPIEKAERINESFEHLATFSSIQPSYR